MEYSFIVPVYNCRQYLRECVECICTLSLKDSEILLIDDGSTDGSDGLCDSLARIYPNIRVIHQANKGASAARNRGIRESTGRRLLFLDADDSFDAAALQAILTDPGCGQADMVIFGLTFDYYLKGNCYRRDPLIYEHAGVMTPDMWGAEFAELFEKNALSPLWNKVFKRDILLQHQLLLNEDLFLYEDLEFVLRYLQHCDTVWNVPQAVYHYRQAEDEGNAKRRLARISCVSEFLIPIEQALVNLCEVNSAINHEQIDIVLQQLYLMLARGKIALCSVRQIRDVCRDFTKWARVHKLPMTSTKFQKQLLEERILQLYLANKKSVLRHRIAVWVKAMLQRI